VTGKFKIVMANPPTYVPMNTIPLESRQSIRTMPSGAIQLRMRRKITHETWEQVKTAHASGFGPREIARNMKIAEGTVLARAKREG
jgi:DNA invertase Pin-like site-specific DNA recombinase